MIRAGIFLDIENLSRSGGWKMRYNVIKDLVRAQGAVILRANAYIAVDKEREAQDIVHRQRKVSYRNAIRQMGFHVVNKNVRRFHDGDGQLVIKADSDLELAIDALVQSENLDYILLGTGDGDFTRLVTALQNRGKRVDLLSFANTSNRLRTEVDYHFNGFLIPDLLPEDDLEERRYRGIMHAVNEERGFGFITLRNGLGIDEQRYDIFCHISDVTDAEGFNPDNETFARFKDRQVILEFDLVEQADGRVKASGVEEFQWQSSAETT